MGASNRPENNVSERLGPKNVGSVGGFHITYTKKSFSAWPLMSVYRVLSHIRDEYICIYTDACIRVHMYVCIYMECALIGWTTDLNLNPPCLGFPVKQRGPTCSS